MNGMLKFTPGLPPDVLGAIGVAAAVQIHTDGLPSDEKIQAAVLLAEGEEL
jgi:hypothetical protein